VKNRAENYSAKIQVQLQLCANNIMISWKSFADRRKQEGTFPEPNLALSASRGCQVAAECGQHQSATERLWLVCMLFLDVALRVRKMEERKGTTVCW